MIKDKGAPTTTENGESISIDEVIVNGITIKGLSVNWKYTDKNIEIQSDLLSKLAAGRIGQIAEKFLDAAVRSIEADIYWSDRKADAEVKAHQSRAAAEDYYRGKNENEVK